MAPLLTFDRCLLHDHHQVSRYFWNWNLKAWRKSMKIPFILKTPVLIGSSCYWWCEAASLTCGWSWDGNCSTRHLVKTTNLDILEYDKTSNLCQHFSRQFSPLVVPKKCAEPTCDLHINLKRWQLSKWWNCSGGDSSAQSFCRSGFFRQLFWRTDGWDYCWEKAW